MIPLDRPPAALSVPIGARMTTGGGWRTWNSGAERCSTFRRDFRAWAMNNQKFRCAFCLLSITDDANREANLDHFAPKSVYKQWTYEPLNLILTCATCNQRFKRSLNPVMPPITANYAQLQWSILHPYIDRDYTAHLVGGYKGGASKPRPIRGVSPRGQKTIVTFELARPGLFHTWDGEYRKARRDRLRERLSPTWKRKLAEGLKELGASR